MQIYCSKSKQGLPKQVRVMATELLKAGVRPGKVEQSLKKEGISLPRNIRKKLININKTIKQQEKTMLGKIETNGELHQWYKKKLVRC